MKGINKAYIANMYIVFFRRLKTPRTSDHFSEPIQFPPVESFNKLRFRSKLNIGECEMTIRFNYHRSPRVNLFYV